MARILFLLFLVVPIIEIALFIMLGQAIGILPTLLGVLVTALIGSALIRMQGVSLIAEIRQMMGRGQVPGRQIAEGVMLAVAGALLLTPGYFTDTCGFLLLIPAIRHSLYGYLASKVTVVSAGGERPQARPGGSDTIDLDPTNYR